jgi:hypothetical protein
LEFHLSQKKKKKNNWKFAISRPTRRSLLPRRPSSTEKFLDFLSGLYKLDQRAKKCIELRGKCVNKFRVWSL